MDRTPNQSNHQTHKKSPNPTTKKDDVRIIMALSDKKSRLSDAKEKGIEKGKKEDAITVA